MRFRVREDPHERRPRVFSRRPVFSYPGNVKITVARSSERRKNNDIDFRARPVLLTKIFRRASKKKKKQTKTRDPERGRNVEIIITDDVRTAQT